VAVFDGPNQWQVRGFVHQAVRLPSSLLADVHSRVTTGDLNHHSAVVRELVAASPSSRHSAEALRTLILREAWTAPKQPASEDVNPDWMAETLIASAEALMEREVLERSPDPRRRDAFTALTEPFRGILDG
jgi:Arc/MetJ-type ribon-helix-helix transcriptional regulator